MIRQPIIAVLGHVDHGKTTLLDKIRGTAVQAREAGGITQQIGATEIPIDTIKKICGNLMAGKSFTIPGLLFIDTPGHEAFTSLRQRGGSIADLAVLVIDINQGIQPQTIESINILKTFKVPFVIACNKIDLIYGWKKQNTTSYLQSLQKQSEQTKEALNTKMYEIIGKLSEQGLNSNIFTQIDDYSKTLALVPTSGITGEGMSELLMVLTGLAQRYLQNKLEIDPESEGRGSVIEVKEEKGLGKTIDVILYNGKIKLNDTIIIAGIEKPIETKVKALLKPAPLTELRQTKKYEHMKIISAAAGVKIAGQNFEEVISGMPFIAGAKDEEKAREELQKGVGNILINTEEIGVLIKAESIGSLEALTKILSQSEIKIKSAGIGNVNKNDVMTAKGVRENDPYLGVIFAFNVKYGEGAQELIQKEKIKVFEANIIYKLEEEYTSWKKKLLEEKQKEILTKITNPVKVQVQQGCIFRQSSPCIVGVEVLGGTLRSNIKVMNEQGKNIGKLKGLQSQNENVAEAKLGERLAISIESAKADKDFKEGEFLYSDISENEFKTLRNMQKFLGKTEIDILKEIKAIKQKSNALWGHE